MCACVCLGSGTASRSAGQSQYRDAEHRLRGRVESRGDGLVGVAEPQTVGRAERRTHPHHYPGTGTHY